MSKKTIWLVIAALLVLLGVLIFSGVMTIFNWDFTKLSTDESQALFLLSMILTIILPAVFGTGPASAAMSYVLRNYVNDTHSWVWGDFKDNFKSNFKQGLIVYLIDTVIICMFAVSIFFYSVQMGGSLISLALRAIVFAVFVIFMLMHLYVYPIMATFKLSVKNIYRNSLLLSMAKLPWSILTAAVVGLLIYGAIYLVVSSGLGIFAIILLYFSLVNFTSIFMTNGVIRKFMLEPALAQQNEGKTDIDSFNEDDVVFEDVTERRSKRG